MKLWMLGLALTLFAQVAFSRTPPQIRKPTKKTASVESNPVFRITGKLVFEGKVIRGSIRKSEIDSLIARRVKLLGAPSDAEYGKYGIGFIYQEGKLPAFSCQEWAQARVLGLDSSLNTYERTRESFFIDTCSFLYALKDASLAMRSFIASPNVGVSNLNLLPVNLLETLSGDNVEGLDDSTASRMKISHLVAKGKAKVLRRTKTSLALEYEFDPDEAVFGYRIVFTERGRADFDGDGIEDIFISSAWYAIQRTFRAYDYFLLTRRDPSAGFQVMKLELPAIKENPALSIPALELKSGKLKRVRLAKKMYGDSWPFNAEKGELACVKSGSTAVFWIANGSTYPLNAWAIGSKIDGVAVVSDTCDVENGKSLSAIFNKAFAMCRTKGEKQ